MAVAFIAAVRAYFGARDKNLSDSEARHDFMKEYRALTPQDKLDLHKMLQAEGVDVEPPTGTASGGPTTS